MRNYSYDHIHLRSPDPDATVRFFETMFGAEVTRDPGTRLAFIRGPESIMVELVQQR